MTIVNKLIGLAIANQGFSDNSRMLKHFLSSITAILALVLMMTMMTATLVIGGLYAGYLALLAHGYTDYQSLSVIGGVIFAAVAVLAVFLNIRLKKLRRIPGQFSFNSFGAAPVTSKLVNVGQAFMDGLMQKP